MMITIYLGDDPHGYQGRHLLLVDLRVRKLVDEGFDELEDSFHTYVFNRYRAILRPKIQFADNQIDGVKFMI
jgi:hypothetical protein